MRNKPCHTLYRNPCLHGHCNIIVAGKEHIRMFGLKKNRAELVKEFLLMHEKTKGTRCIVHHKNENILHYKPGHYETKTIDENGWPVDVRHKISAWLDEAVWNNDLRYLAIFAPRFTYNTLCDVLSAPVLARVILLSEDKLDQLNTASLIKRLPGIVPPLLSLQKQKDSQ